MTIRAALRIADVCAGVACEREGFICLVGIILGPFLPTHLGGFWILLMELGVGVAREVLLYCYIIICHYC